ncbi:MAG: acyl carrier protein [Pseudomonadota bacterium]
MSAATLLAEALNVPSAEVDGSTSLSDTAAWDSLAHFRLVLAVEEKLGRKLDPVEIVSLVDLAAVEGLLNRS